jgi:hypothetical protein
LFVEAVVGVGAAAVSLPVPVVIGS